MLDPVDDHSPRITWLAVFALFTAAWALRFAYFTLDDLTRDHAGTVARRLIEEGTGAYTAMLLFPIILAFERRFPLSSGRWRNWPGHLGGLVLFTPLHTALMAGSRWIIFPALGLGQYDYGRMPLRFFMEAPEDVITYSTILCLLTFLRVQQELRAREVRAAVLERDAAQAKLASLSLRLQPHFLFNALNTISSIVYDDPIAADEMIGRLGDLLRHALRSGDRQEITVNEELETLRAYLAFIEARFGDRVRVAFDVDESASDLAVPAFMLQPLVENAVRHGAAREYHTTTIVITILADASSLHVTVDNETGDEMANPPRIGTGLGTTRDRLRLLYGDASSLHVLNDHGHFRVKIRLPARRLAPESHPISDAEHAGAHR
jgi:two-component system, LytTR family, sensor kinase